MKMPKLFLLALACTWSVGAVAQWQWIDKDGRKVFSDRAPPPDIPAKSVLKQPAGTPAPALAAAEPAAASALAPRDAARAPGKDKELEEKKIQAEAAEAAKKKAEEDKLAALRADNCSRAKQAKATFDSGKLLRQTNAQGELVFLDEAGRAAETRRIEGIIASDCKR
ncbi:DUF4124 domain-containing protein [Acidovorax sp. SRB_14]|uniref:DUF4124 domain-containing protein n=1 Tax=unclassified Acidovorax TaxID=2684926 RepID=UPI00145CBDD9|nr:MULTISPECIES: DUF4124 domain-containing protein [unclassified Acidovorax]NMM75288.1 DUF4124 domain-containing protein [Acidovorax sp. SRB_24]NMM80796.1 DUF4124 domain-containing protein [Acidovorax sp. SRB_14]NMM85768.1 DUF4124 domain-containing protein [Rhodococcus sp. SRB_17]